MNRRHFPIVSASVITFFIFAVLLNSVGPVILQSILSFGVPKPQAALLEGFKDLSIAAASFLVSLFLPALGYRRGTALGLVAVALACALVPVVGAFWVLKLQFAVVGIAFAVAKTSVYVVVGLITDTPKKHASATSTLEGIFMVGVLSSYWLFSAFIDPVNPAALAWLNVYWLLAGSALVAAGLFAFAPLEEAAARDELALRDQVLAMPRLLPVAFVLLFLISAFLDVLVEQSLGTWLPTFNREVLQLSPALAVQLASLYAAGLALGRLGAGVVLRHVPWIWVVGVGVCLAGGSISLAVMLAQPVPGSDHASWQHLPLGAFLLPMTGLFLAPVYPILCSAVLSGLPKRRHSAMTGLILISSALGGTIGSLITGRIFAMVSGGAAFVAVLPSLAALFVAMIAFHLTLQRARGMA